MLDDILSETPLAKHLEGLGEERGVKRSLLSVVSARFPALRDFAQTQTAHLTDTNQLNLLIVQLSIAQTEEDARQYLLGLE